MIAERCHQGPGGKGANQAIGIHRLGGDVLFISKVGADDYGQAARSLFTAEGLSARGISTGTAPTGVALIMVDEAGGNMISVAPGANAQLTSAEVMRDHGAALRQAKVVLLQLECTTELAEGVIKEARRAGVITVLNPAPARPLPKALLGSIDFLTPNETELRTLCGSLGIADSSVDVLATKMLDFGVRNVVVTLGEQGALWASRNGVNTFNAYRVEATDTTGAGDAFNAGFTVRLAAGDPVGHAIDYGCRAGAYCVTQAGVIDGLARPGDLADLAMLRN